MHLCIFEDETYANFFPATYLRPTFGMRCGLYTLHERIVRALKPDRVSYLCRVNLNPTLREARLTPITSAFDIEETMLFVNGTVIDAYDLANCLHQHRDQNTLFIYAGRVVAAHLDTELAREFTYYLLDQHVNDALESLSGAVQTVEIAARMARYLWDLIAENAAMIRQDFEITYTHNAANGGSENILGQVDRNAVLYNPDDIYIGPGARIDAMAVLDARDGPIVIGPDVRVQPFSYIQGPTAIGAGTYIVGGQMREGTCIGPVCRIGGEVEESIIQGYTNKYHAGFLGHSYLGEWVNIGAIATNSDLKNTYSTIRMEVNNDIIDTGRQKMGVVLGDHAKVGIGVMLVGGATVGVGSNIMNGMAPKVVPCFVWSDGQNAAEYNLEQFLGVAERSMSRRKVTLSTPYGNLLRHVFYQTKPQRVPGR